jgi:hypothetical protein
MFRRFLPKPSKLTAFCTALTAVCLLAVTAAQQPQRPYRILISNDGVRAPALPVLAQALKPIGDVIIVAPAEYRRDFTYEAATNYCLNFAL